MLYITFFLNLHPFRPYPLNHYLPLGLPLLVRPLLMVGCLLVLKYRTHTDAFDVVWADKAIFGIMDGGPAKAVADGFYILTEPLKNGSYPVHFKSSLICPDPDCADPNFVQDIQYKIIAE